MARGLIAAVLVLQGCAGGDRTDSDEGDIWGTSKLEDLNPDPQVVEVALTARPARVTLLGHEVEMMTYEGQFPGPRIEAKVGDQIVVRFTNALPEPTTIHWHGLRISDQMDGNPRIQDPVPPGGTFEYRFIAPEAGSFWYHPHVRAHEQLERGLYGSIVIHGADDPVYDRERALLLDDITIDPQTGTFPPTLVDHMELVHGRMGATLLTNGRPSAEVVGASEQGAVERWRIVNTSNARTMKLSIRGATFRVIGTDGGLLATPYEATHLLVAVGQRYDLEVSYGDVGRVELVSHVLEVIMGEIVEVAQVAVFAVEVRASNRAHTPIAWPKIEDPPARTVSREVQFEFDARMDSATAITWLINGEAHRHDPLFTFTRGDTVRMRLVNLKNPEHPFHLHGQFFQVVSPAERGLKDTVLVPGKSTVEIVAFLDNPGRWMAHCHILEHAELGMMSEIVVENSP